MPKVKAQRAPADAAFFEDDEKTAEEIKLHGGLGMQFGHGCKCEPALAAGRRAGYDPDVNTTSISSPDSNVALKLSAPDLTRHPPRSPRVQLGGYAILPRCLDKGRATIAGQNGEYHFACPLDQQFLTFAGIVPEDLRAQLAAGKSDGEILTWVQVNAKNRHSVAEIEAWVRQQEKRGPADADTQAYFDGEKARIAGHRPDIRSWFDFLDVDDYVTFGGRS